MGRMENKIDVWNQWVDFFFLVNIYIYIMENKIDVWNHQPDDVFPRINQQRLVGGFNLPLWKIYEFVSWDYYSKNMETCSKPPTRR